MTVQPSDFPSPLRNLLAQLPLAPLGPGVTDISYIESLQEIRTLFPEKIAPDSVNACIAGLYLAFGFLNESHSISQELDTPEGSYWHALMHRREPDASNSKYWWHRVGKHPVFGQLGEQAARLGWKQWDPAAFVDLCEHERDTGSERELLLREIQLDEWKTLFAWCYRGVTQAKG